MRCAHCGDPIYTCELHVVFEGVVVHTFEVIDGHLECRPFKEDEKTIAP